MDAIPEAAPPVADLSKPQAQQQMEPIVAYSRR